MPASQPASQPSASLHGLYITRKRKERKKEGKATYIEIEKEWDDAV
jgi:hypothetical protein